MDKLFPKLTDKKIDASMLKIDKESLCMISTTKASRSITNIMLRYSSDYSNATIMDMTAGVGGNTISFAQYYKNVVSVEINEKRCKLLANNVNVYELKNVKICNNDCVNIYNKINANVVFMDPPWGGRDYKYQKNIRLRLSGMHIENICNLLYYHNNDIVIGLKLPRNYDVGYLKMSCTGNFIIDIITLKKMYVVVLSSRDIY